MASKTEGESVMTLSTKPFVAALAAFAVVGATFVAHAEEALVETQALDPETADSYGEVEYTDEEVVYATPDTDYSSSHVWWGNRSVAHDSYIKFERIDVARAPFAPSAAPSAAPFLNNIYFDPTKPAVLTPASRAELNKAVAYLRAAPGAKALIRAEGTATDERTVQAIRNYLGENGISGDRVTTNPDAQFEAGTVVIPYGTLGR